MHVPSHLLYVGVVEPFRRAHGVKANDSVSAGQWCISGWHSNDQAAGIVRESSGVATLVTGETAVEDETGERVRLSHAFAISSQDHLC